MSSHFSLEVALAATTAVASDSLAQRAEKKAARRAVESLVAQVQAADDRDGQDEDGQDEDEEEEVGWRARMRLSNSRGDPRDEEEDEDDGDAPMTVRLSEAVLERLASSLDESGDLDTAVFTVEASADGRSPPQSLPFSELMARFARLKASGPLSPAAPRVTLRFADALGARVGFGWARDTATQRVVQVTRGGQAAAAGVQAGWRVAAVGGSAVPDNAAFEAAVAAARATGANAVEFEFEALPAPAATGAGPAAASAAVSAGKPEKPNSADAEPTQRQAPTAAARATGAVAEAMLAEASQAASGGGGDQWASPTYGVASGASSGAAAAAAASERLPVLTAEAQGASRTLVALRALVAAGHLSASDKAKLVTAMVQAKAAGSQLAGTGLPSLVEVGFEVLVGVGDEGSGSHAEGMADFAEYCRALAQAPR
jgi:hypothetical protein